MKIIIDVGKSGIEAHAKKVLRARELYLERHPHAENIVPRGIATHAARYPVICDDCGVTFWANDPYAAHQKCSAKNGKVGF